MEGITRTPMHHGEHRQPPRRRGHSWAAWAGGIVVLTAALTVGLPALDGPVTAGTRLTGPIGSVVSTTPATAAPATAAPVVTATVQAPPVEVPPPTVRIHRGNVVQDCFMSDPLIPIYFCPIGGP